MTNNFKNMVNAATKRALNSLNNDNSSEHLKNLLEKYKSDVQTITNGFKSDLEKKTSKFNDFANSEKKKVTDKYELKILIAESKEQKSEIDDLKTKPDAKKK